MDAPRLFVHIRAMDFLSVREPNHRPIIPHGNFNLPR